MAEDVNSRRGDSSFPKIPLEVSIKCSAGDTFTMVRLCPLCRNSTISGDTFQGRCGLYSKPEGQSTTCLHVGECKGQGYSLFFK